MYFNWGRKTLHIEWFNLDLKSMKCLKAQSTYASIRLLQTCLLTSTFHIFVDFYNCVITLIYIIAFFLIKQKLIKYLALLLSKIYCLKKKKKNSKCDIVLYEYTLTELQNYDMKTIKLLHFRPMKCKETAICKLRWNYFKIILYIHC